MVRCEAELNGTEKLVFGMLKWREYYGIIAQRTPYKSHNAKHGWFVLVCDVIMLQAYCQ